MRNFVYVLGLVFMAEMADKTQLAVLGLSTGSRSRITVFVASSLALILSTGLAVIVGDALTQWLPQQILESGVGLLFIGIGVWYLFGVYS